MPREPVDPGRLRTDITLALQAAKTRTTLDNLTREAFHAVAELIVSYNEGRGYEVTAPKPKPAGPAPEMALWQPSRGPLKD